MILSVTAQDAYHSNLQSFLQQTHNLPMGEWVLNDSENANLNSDFWYGNISASNQPAGFQEFEQKANIKVNAAGSNTWDAGYGIRNVETINGGDVCLLVIWLQSVDGPGNIGLFAENSMTFEKEVFFNLELSVQWTRYIVPFEAKQTYTPGGLTLGAHLASQAQTIGIGGMAILNYRNTISIDDLPSQTNNDQYGGFEADAPWRAEAASRIEQLRKADLTVKVEDANGDPIENATVQLEMINHEFAFGAAVVSRLFAGNNGQNNTYQSKLLDLDGKGHGFNWVVFENALKWPGWENNWITTPPQTAKAVRWLDDHNIKIRGHTLLWPGFYNMPNDIEDNQGNLEYIKGRIFDHMEEILTYPDVGENIKEWDVLNEITTNRDLEYSFQGSAGYPTGRELYAEVFEKLEELDPNTKTYINDYVTISQANSGGGLYDLKKQFTQEIIDSGVELDGIGFQGHIGAFPTSIYAVQSTLDDFYESFGLTAKITEYDTNIAMGDELAATYLRDFLTMVFSHESMDGFMMWGFWDGAHWHGNAPMFYEDWTIKPAGQAFVDLVYGDWWTEEGGATDVNGEYAIRGYKGEYQVTIDCGTSIIVDTINLTKDMVIVKADDELSTGVSTIKENRSINVFPNPAKDFVHIELEGLKDADVHIFDTSGKLLHSQKLTNSKSTIPLTFGSGIFKMVFKSNNYIKTKRLIVQE